MTPPGPLSSTVQGNFSSPHLLLLLPAPSSSEKSGINYNILILLKKNCFGQVSFTGKSYKEKCSDKIMQNNILVKSAGNVMLCS